MTDVLDPASTIAAAQEAAAAGDFPNAERLLREAAAIQEATLGSEHPDLATTLNNLAFVCERTNKIDEAERGYRRAHAIAVASMGPRHPFVATSIRNLVDFCAAHDIPIWTPPGAASDDAPAIEADPDRAIEPRTEDREAPVPGLRWPVPRTIAVAALGAVILVVIGFAMRSQQTTASPRIASAAPPAAPAVTLDPSPTLAVDANPAAAPTRIERPEPREKAERPASRDGGKIARQAVTVLTAQLCSALEKRGSPDWQCTMVGGNLPPATYIFYTRLQTDANTTVEHRWYRDDRLHQVMRLRVIASGGGGFRTFSSNTISAERSGSWKVEVRAADGMLLQEEHFVIR
jgi:DUF2914 family protein/tetratricopeptide repeat protein